MAEVSGMVVTLVLLMLRRGRVVKVQVIIVIVFLRRSHLHAGQDIRVLRRQFRRVPIGLVLEKQLTMVGAIQNGQLDGVDLDVVDVIRADVGRQLGEDARGGWNRGLSKRKDKRGHPANALTDIVPAVS